MDNNSSARSAFKLTQLLVEGLAGNQVDWGLGDRSEAKSQKLLRKDLILGQQ